MKRQAETSLQGKVVLITGASPGMGKQAALGFARMGANVVVAARTVDPDNALPGSLGETMQEIEAFGGKALAVQTGLGWRGSLRDDGAIKPARKGHASHLKPDETGAARTQ